MQKELSTNLCLICFHKLRSNKLFKSKQRSNQLQLSQKKNSKNKNLKAIRILTTTMKKILLKRRSKNHQRRKTLLLHLRLLTSQKLKNNPQNNNLSKTISNMKTTKKQKTNKIKIQKTSMRSKDSTLPNQFLFEWQS